MRRLAVLVGSLVVAVGCGGEQVATDGSGVFAGQVVVSGPLRAASLSVDQVDLETGEVRVHVAETITDEEGRFSIEVGLANGLLRATARGGSFEDLASGATIQLDATDELSSVVWFDLLEERDDILVSPVGHLVDARARFKLTVLGDISHAIDDATSHLHRHFGNVDWTRLQAVSLTEPATSPTEGVRAALVQASLSFLAKDIADEAGASPQEVNPYTLTRQLAADIAQGVFDGNDGNDRAHASGLQLGSCPPVAQSCTPPTGICGTGACRTLCDLYVGTPRALLAGTMTKVIRDPGVNQTGLDINDTLAVAQSMANNVDDDLFGDACIETLDRLPPMLRWDVGSAPEGAVVAGSVTLQASATDDTDPNPRAEILDHPDADGDPTNSIARALVDTTVHPDGGLVVVARATDIAGNVAMISRALVVDNTAPVVELEPTGYYVSGTTWWTAAAGPTLSGTLIEVNPASIKAVIGATQVTGTISGATWSVTVPAGLIDQVGTPVTIVVTDQAGNVGQATQLIRYDATPPDLSFDPSSVIDEAEDTVTYTTSGLPELAHIPQHQHIGPKRDLTAPGTCPTFHKFSYLLGASPPRYGRELPARNPILYQLVTADDGVGLAPGSTQYRVGRRTGGSTTWVLDWTDAGAGTPVATGVTRHALGIYTHLVPGLDSTEGIYDVEFRTTDHLARTTTATRCFDLKLRAPPLEFETASLQPSSHDYGLDGLGLATGPGVPFDVVAQRLLNDNASGAALIDQPFYNGTASTVYLTVTVTKPAQVNATMQFSINHAPHVVETVSINCGTNLNPVTTADCTVPEPTYTSTVLNAPATPHFPVRVFEVDSDGVPTTEIPCLGGCMPSDTEFKFAIPPRTVGPPPGSLGRPARRFRALTMIGPVPQLWPQNVNHPAMPPFFDDALPGGTRISGQLKPAVWRCTRMAFTGPNQDQRRCDQRALLVHYRALIRAGLSTNQETISTYATAPAEGLDPVFISLARRQNIAWQRTESALPTLP